jgi:hypothetical protein
MVCAEQVFHIHGSPAQLLSVHGANQWLFAHRIFLAHAASLRQTYFFARWKFRGFLRSFFLKGAGLDATRSTTTANQTPKSFRPVSTSLYRFCTNVQLCSRHAHDNVAQDSKK